MAYNDDTLRAMTLNERLSALGRLTEFDVAARRQDKQVMIAILQKAALSQEEASELAASILSNPKRYGF